MLPSGILSITLITLSKSPSLTESASALMPAIPPPTTIPLTMIITIPIPPVDTSGEDDNLDFNNLLSILNYMHPE